MEKRNAKCIFFVDIKMKYKVNCFSHIKFHPPSANLKNSMKKLRNASFRIFVYKNVTQIVLLFVKG